MDEDEIHRNNNIIKNSSLDRFYKQDSDLKIND